MNILRLFMLPFILLSSLNLTAATSANDEYKECKKALKRTGFERVQQTETTKAPETGNLLLSEVFGLESDGVVFFARLKRAQFSNGTTYAWSIDHDLEPVSKSAVAKGIHRLKDFSATTNGEAIERLIRIVKAIYGEDFFDISYFRGFGSEAYAPNFPGTSKESSFVVRVHRKANRLRKIFPDFRGFKVHVEIVDDAAVKLRGKSAQEPTATQRKKLSDELWRVLNFDKTGPAYGILPVTVYDNKSKGGRPVFLQPREILSMLKWNEVKNISLGWSN